MVKVENIVLTLIVIRLLKKLYYLIVQVFTALNVKNNKVDPYLYRAYIHLKKLCQIQNQQ